MSLAVKIQIFDGCRHLSYWWAPDASEAQAAIGCIAEFVKKFTNGAYSLHSSARRLLPRKCEAASRKAEWIFTRFPLKASPNFRNPRNLDLFSREGEADVG